MTAKQKLDMIEKMKLGVGSQRCGEKQTTHIYDHIIQSLHHIICCVQLRSRIGISCIDESGLTVH